LIKNNQDKHFICQLIFLTISIESLLKDSYTCIKPAWQLMYEWFLVNIEP
jgi:hypothetical protein